MFLLTVVLDIIKAMRLLKRTRTMQIIATFLTVILGIFTIVIYVTNHSNQTRYIPQEPITRVLGKGSNVPSQVQQAAPNNSPIPAKSAVPRVAHLGFCMNVPVLTYHHVEPQAQAIAEGHPDLNVDIPLFDSQMQYLVQRGYAFINAEDLATALIKHQRLNRKTVVVTFDDSYDDFYTNAFPIIQKYHIVTSMMFVTGHAPRPDPGYMSWQNLLDTVNSGLVFAYDHTWSHANLAQTSETQATFEILTAKQQLEDKLKKPVVIMAYPYGAYNQSIVTIAKNNGIIAAYSTISSTLQCDSYLFALRRLTITNKPLASYGL